MTPPSVRTALLPYAIAALATTSALALMLILEPLLASVRFIPFLAAVVVSAWFAGLRAAVFATLLSLLVGTFYFFGSMQPAGSGGYQTVLPLAAFALVSLALSWSITRLRVLQRDLSARAADLARMNDALRLELAERRHAETAQREARAEVDRARERLQTLYEATKQIGESLSLDLVLSTVLDASGRLLAADRAAIYRRRDAGDYVCLASFGLSTTYVEAVCRHLTTQYARAPAAGPQAPVVVEDLAAAPPGHLLAQLTAAEGSRAAIVVSLRPGQGADTLVIYHDQPHRYPPEDVEIAQALANQAAVAIENARLYEAEQQARLESDASRREVEALLESTRHIATSLDLSATLDSVLDAVIRLCACDAAGVALIDAAGTMVKYQDVRGGPEVELIRGSSWPLGKGVTGTVVQTGRAIVVPDATREPRWLNRPLSEAGGIRAAVCVPLRERDRVIGALTCWSRRAGYFTGTHERMLSGLAEQAALAIAHAHDVTRRRRAERWLDGQRNVLELIATDVPLADVLDALCRLVEAESGEMLCSVLLLDAEAGCLRHGAAPSLPAGFCRAVDGIAIGPAMGSCGTAAYLGKPVIVADIATDPLWQGYRELPLEHGLAACWSTPLLSKDGAVLGTFAQYYREPRAPRPEDWELIQAATHLARIAIERRQAEEALREGNRRLEAAIASLAAAQQQLVAQERLRALGEMASGIAHDFNNTLAPILGFSELLMARPEILGNREKAIEYLGLINTGARDAANVVMRLREFYRPREEEDVHRPVDLNQLVGQVAELTQPKWRDQALANGVTITLETDLGEILPIAGDEPELREALMNLIFNAVDAMPADGTITLRTHLRGHVVVVDVADSGVGMSETVRQRCLEPFFTTKGERGTGLGLAAVYGIVRRHSGEIAIASTPGKGTTFSLQFPVRTAPPALDGGHRDSHSSGPLHVLVVDDEPLVRRVVEEYLHIDHHAVETAGGGVEALEKLQSGSFDLVVTDRAMPGMSGDQLAVAVKEHSPDTRVIMLTGFGNLMQASGESPRGVDGVVGKPVTLAALRQMVAAVMEVDVILG
ncbi:MAG: GAF domain-containing protein [Chloroflexi bacterium]|nr:GAF domain-containing protein [Chloroflexota bacterium]